MGMLIALILVLALVGGVLGTVLELAFWAVVVTAVVFAVLGYGVWWLLIGGASRANRVS